MSKPGDKYRREVHKVLRKWKENKISLIEAAQEFCALGMPSEAAWALLERT